MAIVPVDEFVEGREDEFEGHRPPTYIEWQEDQGLPVHSGLYVEDVHDLATDDWDLTGERGAFVNLYGAEALNDLQVQELTPGGRTNTQHHLYEEIVYVAEGSGITTIGDPDGEYGPDPSLGGEGADENDETTFEWSEGALFYVPRATPFRHANMSADDRALLLSSTTLPMLFFLLKSESFIFDPRRNHWAEMDPEDFYTADGTLYSGEYPKKGYHRQKPTLWDANFVPDVLRFDKLNTDLTSGVTYSNAHFPMPDSSMYVHVGEFPVGTYKMAHRHKGGAHLLFLSGEGYSLLWDKGWDEKVKVDWGPGTLVVPPTGWFHHHFNTSAEAARDIVWHAPELLMFRNPMLTSEVPENTIKHSQEDAEVRETFEAELAKNGLDSQMPDDAYRADDYVPEGEEKLDYGPNQ